jgi:sulfoxide reductase catalytic subunit YedY
MPPWKASGIAPSEITPRALFEARRRFLGMAAGAGAGLLLGGRAAAAARAPDTRPLGTLASSPLSTAERLTPYSDVTTYNNFYEFGSSKGDPSLYAYKLPIRPWTVTLDGLVHRPRQLDIDEIIKLAPLEERIYRLRCVEAWSMVIPWVGFPLSVLLKQVEPLGSARFVRFESYYDREVITPHFFGFLEFPYIEGLRLDEAMHPLSIAAVGLYGDTLPRQNGAPVRVVVPWKYGFKSAKSIVRISFVEDQPLTSWPKAEHNDYGFYSNVNPNVSRQRWEQSRERRLGEMRKRETLMFNGYADQVASLYAGMDLQRNF